MDTTNPDEPCPDDRPIATCTACGRTIYAGETFQVHNGHAYCADDAWDGDDQ